MDFEDFKNELMELVTMELDNRSIENISLKFNTINSPDGMTDRLIATVGDSKMSMAFRLKEIFTDYENGVSLERCVDRICNTIKENISVIETKEGDVKAFITDYDQVKNHTFFRLVPGDSPVLKEAPHRKIQDMALVVSAHLVDFSDEHGKSVVVVTKPLMEMYGIDEKQLFEDAEKNSVSKEPIVFTPLVDMIKNLIKNDEVPSPEEVGIVTYIATNKSGFHGAAVAAYPEFLDQAAETIGGSFYMLPSSVHEFILIKDDGKPNAKDLNRMIKNVNETVLEPRDFLSNQCYHYDAKTKVLETGVKYDKSKGKEAGAR
ncbi:MAG: DUF5688 family protein [Saccharofermentans sp.]|nr:DUF5688 family protein [Saccharofermentans sp.]